MVRLVVVAVSLALLVAVPATAESPSPRSQSSPPQTLTVSVNVTSFHAAAKGKTTAEGTVSAVLADSDGHSTHIKQPVSLAVKSGGSCRILALVLDQLKLNLLGLNVSLDKVNLQITGKRRGGVLGSLFCKLANTSVKGKVAAARALSRRVQNKPLRPLAFSVPLRAVAAQSGTPTCQVLTLILGPLNLNLLGLVVDLNQVHLSITASRGQGALGDLFCQLADNNQNGQPASG
jgi:hypothetical protein